MAPSLFNPPFPDPAKNLTQITLATADIIPFGTVLYFECVGGGSDFRFDHDYDATDVNVTALDDESGSYSNYLEDVFCESERGK